MRAVLLLAFVVASGAHAATLSVGPPAVDAFFVQSQFPPALEADPMRIAGLSWNLLTIATVFAVVAGVRQRSLEQPRYPVPASSGDVRKDDL